MRRLTVAGLFLVSIAVASPGFDEELTGRPDWHVGLPPSPMTFDADSNHTYDVRHYRLDLDLPMTNASYVCHEQVSLASEVPALDTVPLDFAGLVCDSVKRNGTGLTFLAGSGLLKVALDVPLGLRESTVLDVFFHRESTGQQIGFYFGRPPNAVYAHAMTSGCPRDNHYWFACWDLPNDKAERGCMMNITVPDTFQACSNGWLDSVTPVPGQPKKTWWWRHPYPICPYLMTFSASRFARWDTIVTTPSGEIVPLQYFMWPQDSASTRYGYRMVPDMMTYFADTSRFGSYPFEKYGMVPGYYGFQWGGMENQTLVMLAPSYIGGGHESTIAHELSHMWWGDMVTHVGYADVWLNEGFGTWAECLYMGHMNGRSFFQNYIAGKARSFFSQHRSRPFPMYNPAWPDIYNYGVIYCKGSWIPHMLRFVTGDTAWEQSGTFFRVLRAYRDSFPYGTVSTDDFRRVCEAGTELDLDWFFDEWVYQGGFPRYHLDWTREQVGGVWRFRARLAQRNDTASPALFHMPYPVRVNCQSESVLMTFHPQDTVTTDSLDLGSMPLSVTPDPDDWILDSCHVTMSGVEERGDMTQFGSANWGRVPSISPNPCRAGVVLLRWDMTEFSPANSNRAPSLSIFDNAGRLVRHSAFDIRHSPFALDLRGLSAGVYFVRLAGARPGPLARFVLTE